MQREIAILKEKYKKFQIFLLKKKLNWNVTKITKKSLSNFMYRLARKDALENWEQFRAKGSNIMC